MKKLEIYIRLNNFFVYRTETWNQSLAADTVLESTLKDAVSEVGEKASSQKFDNDQRKLFCSRCVTSKSFSSLDLSPMAQNVNKL